ncbi:MAG: phage protease [Betaproteobacteria bacterium]|nr:phage protease [Betaproteobacteria bacterium]
MNSKTFDPARPAASPYPPAIMPPPPVIALAACALELSAAPELRILPAGTFRARDGRPKEAPAWRLDRALAEALMRQVAARGDRLVIDYEHQTLNAEKNGQPAPAAGWFKTLEWRDPATHGEAAGLYATDVEWTGRARAMIEAGEYRYLSPVFGYDATGAVVDLMMAAITNAPALDGLDELTARAAARFSIDGGNEMSELLKKLLGALGLPETTAEDQAIAQVAALKSAAAQVPELQTQVAALKAQAPDPAKYVPVDTMKTLQGEVAALTAKLHQRDLDELVEAALGAGKLLPAQESWARELGATNLAALKTYIATAQPIAALKGTQSGGRGPASSDPSQPLEARCKAEFDASPAIREEFGALATYTAYCRAHEAGQVKMLTKGDQE